jgi:hypothetical protein
LTNFNAGRETGADAGGYGCTVARNHDREGVMSGADPAAPPQPDIPERVECQVCHRQLPAAQALRQEADDYVLWFCGSNCYRKWQEDGAVAQKD